MAMYATEKCNNNGGIQNDKENEKCHPSMFLAADIMSTTPQRVDLLYSFS